MKYFTHLSHHNKPSNRLQMNALALLEKRTNLLIDDADAFVADLKERVRQLNAEFSKCQPLECYTYGSPTRHVTLGAQFTVSFNLHPVRNGDQT